MKRDSLFSEAPSFSGIPILSGVEIRSVNASPSGQELTAVVGGKGCCRQLSDVRRTGIRERCIDTPSPEFPDAVHQPTDEFVAGLTYFTVAWLVGTNLSFGSITPRFLTTLKMPLLAWAMYMFNRA
jgi:hypothetical protein